MKAVYEYVYTLEQTCAILM